MLQSRPKEYFSFIQTNSETITSTSYPALLQAAIGDKTKSKVIVLLATDNTVNAQLFNEKTNFYLVPDNFYLDIIFRCDDAC